MTDEQRADWERAKSRALLTHGEVEVKAATILAVADDLAAAERQVEQDAVTRRDQCLVLVRLADDKRQLRERAEQAERDRDEARRIVAAVVEGGEVKRLRAIVREFVAIQDTADSWTPTAGSNALLRDRFIANLEAARAALAGEAKEGK